MNLIRTAIKRPVTVWMGILTLLLFGMVGFSRLPLTLLPDMNYPSLTVRTLYPGSAPAEVEQLVSKPIEEALGIVGGLHRINSTSRAGLSDVQLEFQWGTDMNLAALETREKLDAILLPLDVEQPLILRFNPNLDPILRLGVQATGNNDSDLAALRTWADTDLKRQLETVPGVASVRPGGGLVKEVQIQLDQAKLAQLKLTPNQLLQRIKAENINLSAGTLRQGSKELLVRTLNQFESIETLANLIVHQGAGKQVRLKDIAVVKQHYAERTDISRVNGTDAIEIAIYKEGDANAVKVAADVRTRLNHLAERPDARQIDVLYDQSEFIQSAIDEVTSAAIIGAILAMFVVYLFLGDIRPTLIISLSIPISIVATFNLMYFNGISLNLMSLGGIALAVGLLVDNAIVVLENIDRHQKLEPCREVAAQTATNEVSGAIVAATLTTLAVFVPLLFVEGVAGALFTDQALTVTFALLASLIVALTAIPMLASRGHLSWPMPQPKEKRAIPEKPTLKARAYAGMVLSFPFLLIWRHIPMLLMTLLLSLGKVIRRVAAWLFWPILWVFNKSYSAVESLYPKVLDIALKQKGITLAIALMITTLAAALFPTLGMNLIPNMNQGEFYVEIQLPPGTDVTRTDEVLSLLSQEALTLYGVKHAYSQAGSSAMMATSSQRTGENWGRLQVVLTDPSYQESVMDRLRAQASRIPDLKYQLQSPELFSFKKPLTIELSGHNLSRLKLASQTVVRALSQDERYADISNSLRDGQPELSIRFDHARLANLNLTAPDVANRIAMLIGGSVASTYTLGDKKIDIRLRAEATERDQIDDIRDLIVNPNAARPVPLSAVAEIRQSVGPAAIERIDQQRVALISATLTDGTLTEGIARANEILSRLSLPSDVEVRFGGQSDEMAQSSQSLKLALVLALFLVYVVMASQFESFIHPLLILVSVPMALAGSIFGLWATSTPLSALVFIGLIMLCGIVVNNAIVLVDRINQLKAEGQDNMQAIREAANNRLRPILMTTTTTALGLLPMLISMGAGAELRAPMAITVICGLGLSTLLTLLVLPALYAFFDRKEAANG